MSCFQEVGLRANPVQLARNTAVERITAVRSGCLPFQLEKTPKLLVDIVPLHEQDVRMKLIEAERSKLAVGVPVLGANVESPRYLGNGVYFYSVSGATGLVRAYVAYYHYGGTEACRCLPEITHSPSRMIPSRDLTERLVISFDDCLDIQKALVVEPPLLTFLGLVDAEGFTFTASNDKYASDRSKTITGGCWITSGYVRVDDYDFPSDIEERRRKLYVILKPLLDDLWRSAGFPKSPDHDIFQ